MAKSVILHNRFGQCILRLPEKNQGTLKSNGKMEAILFSVAGFLCLLVIIFIVINLRKSKRRSLICLKEKLQGEDRLISDTLRISKLCFWISSFMHNVQKWPKILQKSCGVNKGSYTKIEFHQAQSSKYKEVVKTLSQCRTIGCIDVASPWEMKFLTTPVDNVAATLRGNVVATLWQRRVDFANLKKSYEVYVVLN